MKTPTISVIIATYNSGRTIMRCLQSIRSQIYPQDKIEIVIADGGSSDETQRIAKKYQVRWISVDTKKQNAEYNKSMGLKNAHNEIAAFIDHDNVLPHDKWFLNMVEPLCDHKEVIGVETLRYHYDPSTSLIDRYFALFGVGDPLVWYLGRADRLSYMFDTYQLPGQSTEYGRYYLVKFTENNLPTIGANGFLVRRKELISHARTSPGQYFDMDVNVDLIRYGLNTYAFTKDSILHLTGYGNAANYLKRRMLFFRQYHVSDKGLALKEVRRYSVFEKKELRHLILAVFICITIIIPLYDSLRGWKKIHDTAWFLHPVLSFCFVVLYSWAIMKHQAKLYAKKLLVR